MKDDEPTSELPASERPSDSRPKQRITGDRYRIGEALGRGGMGEVCEARDEQIGRDVAIKRLRWSQPSALQIDRFVREACIQGRLEHPAIVPVHEVGRDIDGLPFFAMKKVAGVTLSSLLTDGAPRTQLLRAFAEVCFAVEFAHVHGVIHRDLKPDNIVLGDYADVYVLDWGVAKVIGDTDEFDDMRSGVDGTVAGAIVGTPKYMSPEQARGDADIDERSDLFSLGRVLGAILDGDEHPPPELIALRDRATAPAREDRIATARELGQDVQRYLDGDRDVSLRRGLARDHLARALEAYRAGDDEEHRRLAIREAGSALALDPTLAGAAELVGRLMIEPPRTIPTEVARAIEADDNKNMQAKARAAMWASLAYVALVPSLIASRSVLYVAMVSMTVGWNLVVAVGSLRYLRIPPPWVLALLNAAVPLVLALMFSPILIAPAVAAMATMVLCTNPFMTTTRSLVFTMIVMIAAVEMPLVLEMLGILPETMTMHAKTLVISSATFFGRTDFMYGTTTAYVLAIVITAAQVGRGVRANERTANSQLHLQAWQLRQLVPDPAAT